MTSSTPDSLLKLAAELTKLGGELSAIGGRLAAAANTLAEEAANIAQENAKQWGVDVQVAVRSGRYGTPGSVIEVKQ